MNDQQMPEDDGYEAYRNPGAYSGSHVWPISCDRAGDARRIAPCPPAVVLPNVRCSGLDFTGVSGRTDEFQRARRLYR